MWIDHLQVGRHLEIGVEFRGERETRFRHVWTRHGHEAAIDEKRLQSDQKLVFGPIGNDQLVVVIRNDL